MKNPLEITFHDIKHNAKIEAIILEKFENVKKISSDVTKCHITLEKLSNTHQSGNRSCVRLDLKVPHINDIIISEKCSEDEASLTKNVIKVFKLGKNILREEVSRIRHTKRTPKEKTFEVKVENEDRYEDLV